MRAQNKTDHEDRDLVEELVGAASEDEYTHMPDGTHNILNEVVVDRGPNASTWVLKLVSPGGRFQRFER